MKNTILLSFAITLALVMVLRVVGDSSHWPPVEAPPRQGEALDSEALKRGQLTHSPLAIARLVREPQNTWSNLAFVFAGASLACTARLKASRLVGGAIITVGIGSFLYHASASSTLRHLDVAAMYGLFITMIMLAGASLHPRIRTVVESWIGLFAAVALAFATLAAVYRNIIILGFKPLALSLVTAAASVLFIGALIIHAGKKRTLRTTIGVVVAISLFLCAVMCQVGDRPGGWLIKPASAVQAHALWHIFSAAALLIAVRLLDVRPACPNR